MSKNNQQRRAANKRRKAQRGASGTSTEDYIWAAVAALGTDRRRYDWAVAGLLDASRRNDDAGRVMDDLLMKAVGALWLRGWTPVDLVRAAGKELGAAPAGLLADIVLDDGAQRRSQGETLHPRWLGQLTELESHKAFDDADLSIEDFIRSLRYVTRLPDLPRTMPAPGERWVEARQGGARIDEGLLGRVRGLLAKAESTEFEAEAEALTAKAQELIARHAIDEALLHRGEDAGDAACRRIPVDDPYADAKSSLVARVAEANRCSAVFSPHWGWCDVFGFDADLDAVELLVASLLAQATGAMARHGSVVDRYGRSSTRSFRRSFLFGFAHRIGERLQETTASEVAKVAAADGSLLPVLASREEVVTAARDAAFPQLKTKRSAVSHGSGYAAGQFAADQASLDPKKGALDR